MSTIYNNSTNSWPIYIDFQVRQQVFMKAQFFYNSQSLKSYQKDIWDPLKLSTQLVLTYSLPTF